MKKICIPLLFLSVLVCFASCSKNNNSDTPAPARVMFMNANLGASGLDVSTNGTKLSGASNLQFLQNTGYMNVQSGTAVDVAFLLSSTQSPFADSTITFTSGGSYSVFAADYVNTPAIVVTTDSLSAPASGMAKVRFINLSPDTLNESVNVGSQLIASGITFKNASAFAQVSAGSYKVVAADPNNLGSTQTIANYSFNAGKIYSIVLSGTANGSGTLMLGLKVIGNN